jgi:hypothetical protein
MLLQCDQTNARCSCSMMRQMYLLVQYDQSDVHVQCQRSYYDVTVVRLILMAASKAWVCGRLLAGNACSNPSGGKEVCFQCCVIEFCLSC